METFDKILLDVPCLGIGVLKRKPDIKMEKKTRRYRRNDQNTVRNLANLFNLSKKRRRISLFNL